MRGAAELPSLRPPSLARSLLCKTEYVRSSKKWPRRSGLRLQIGLRNSTITRQDDGGGGNGGEDEIGRAVLESHGHDGRSFGYRRGSPPRWRRSRSQAELRKKRNAASLGAVVLL